MCYLTTHEEAPMSVLYYFTFYCVIFFALTFIVNKKKPKKKKNINRGSPLSRSCYDSLVVATLSSFPSTLQPPLNPTLIKGMKYCLRGLRVVNSISPRINASPSPILPRKQPLPHRPILPIHRYATVVL
jgi:hypothetical protein